MGLVYFGSIYFLECCFTIFNYRCNYSLKSTATAVRFFICKIYLNF